MRIYKKDEFKSKEFFVDSNPISPNITLCYLHSFSLIRYYLVEERFLIINPTIITWILVIFGSAFWISMGRLYWIILRTVYSDFRCITLNPHSPYKTCKAF